MEHQRRVLLRDLVDGLGMHPGGLLPEHLHEDDPLGRGFLDRLANQGPEALHLRHDVGRATLQELDADRREVIGQRRDDVSVAGEECVLGQQVQVRRAVDQNVVVVPPDLAEQLLEKDAR